MKLLISLVNLMFLTLAIIGDFVLFYLKIIFWLIKKVLKTSKNLFLLGVKNLKTIYKNGTNNLDLGLKNINTKSKLATFRFSLSLKALRKRIFRKRKNTLRAKKIIEERSITIYPAPRNIRLKIKFFLLGFLICFFFILIPLYFYFFRNSLPNPKHLS